MPRRIDRSQGTVALEPHEKFAGFPVSDILFALLVGIACKGDTIEDAAILAADLKSPLVKRYISQAKLPPPESVALLLAAIPPPDFVATFAAAIARLSRWSAAEIIKLHGKSLAGVKGKAALKKDPYAIADKIFIASVLVSSGVDDDTAAKQTLNARDNFADVRHVALNMLVLAKGPDRSFEMKRAQALMDDRYLIRALRPPPDDA